MSTDGLDAELVVADPQRLGQLAPDRPAAGRVGAEQVAEVLAADHRAPRPRHAAAHRGDINRDGDRRRPAPVGAGGDGIRAWTNRRDVGDRGDAVPAFAVVVAGRVGERWVRDRQHVVAPEVDDGERPVGRRSPVHQVPGRAGHGVPVDRHLGTSAAGTEAGRRVEGDRGDSFIVATFSDALDPVGARRFGVPGDPFAGHDEAIGGTDDETLNSSMASSGGNVRRTSPTVNGLVQHAAGQDVAERAHDHALVERQVAAGDAAGVDGDGVVEPARP